VDPSGPAAAAGMKVQMHHLSPTFVSVLGCLAMILTCDSNSSYFVTFLSSFFFFKTEFPYVVHASLELTILLPQPLITGITGMGQFILSIS
jgi:hypothetical protein